MNKTHGPPIVIDNGSGICKAGFAEDEEPKVVFPSLVGRPRCRGTMDQEVIYIGNDAQSQRRDLTLTYPIDSGIVTNWDDMEKIWHHTFNELSVAPEEHPVLLTEAPLNPKANREKIMQVMFETFKTPGVYLSLSAVFTLFASGRTTGLVLESGDCVSQAVPVIEGGVPKGAIQRMDLAGRDLTFYLMKLISKSGHILTTSYGRDIVREIKEKRCQVALDFDLETSAESNTVAKHTYLLPDGEEIMLGNERFLCPEVMFRPSLLSGVFQGEYESLPEIIFNSITKTEYEIQSELYSNIVLGGGNTMFPGFQKRLEREVKKLFPSLTQVKTEAEPYRAYSAWLGGSIVASNSSMDSLWIKKEEYDEYGPSVLYKNSPEWW